MRLVKNSKFTPEIEGSVVVVPLRVRCYTKYKRPVMTRLSPVMTRLGLQRLLIIDNALWKWVLITVKVEIGGATVQITIAETGGRQEKVIVYTSFSLANWCARTRTESSKL